MPALPVHRRIGTIGGSGERDGPDASVGTAIGQACFRVTVQPSQVHVDVILLSRFASPPLATPPVYAAHPQRSQAAQMAA